jgi:hypothetical protein
MWFKKKKDADKNKDKPRYINPGFAPNRAEESHFIRKFYKRRVRQRWLFLLFFVLPPATLGVIYHFRELLFLDGNWKDPSVVTVVILAMLFMAELAIIAISLVNWRCPHCETMAPLRPHPYQCKHCKARLRFSRLRENDDREDEDDADDDDVDSDHHSDR